MSCIMGSLTSSLLIMVSKISIKDEMKREDKDLLEECIKINNDITLELLELRKKDEEAYKKISEIIKLKKDNPERNQKLEIALVESAKVQKELLYKVCDIIYQIESINNLVKNSIVSDLGIALSSARSLADSALFTVYANTKYMKNANKKKEINTDANNIYLDISGKYNKLYPEIVKRIGEGI